MEFFRDLGNMTPDRKVTVGEVRKVLKNREKYDRWLEDDSESSL